jgi:predicted helicase
VRFGDQLKGGAKQEEQSLLPIFSDFLEPARKAGAGVHLKNLYNDYVYFWRWALWRLFEQQSCGGIVTFITASSYLAGPGFIGMREVMRRKFDELWVIDLGGDNLGTRKTPNVFAIQTPVAVAMGVRGPKASLNTPAKTRYVQVTGATREAKLARLAAVAKFSDLDWRSVPMSGRSPFFH